MIIVKVMGGLGNQFFQYALYRHFQENGEEAYLDLSWYEPKKKNNRVYQLDLFNTKVIECTEKQKYSLANNDKNIFSIAKWMLFGGKKTHMVENQRDKSDVDILNLKSAYLEGYWQRKEYFKDIMSILEKELTLKEDFDTKNSEVLKKINSTNSVSVHIRRGDYLLAQDIYGGICTEEYYKKALTYMDSHIISPHYFVFSDDMEWCKKFFGGARKHNICRYKHIKTVFGFGVNVEMQKYDNCQ
jgi:hypothetical protein